MLQLKKIIVLLMLVFGFQLSSAQINILNAKVAGDIGVKTEAQIALRDNAKAFYKELSRWTQEKLQDLSEMMVNLATLVVISTPNFNSAYRIFSVLNSRGLPLAPADIFKS